MGLTWLDVADLTVEDERSLAHVEIYADLRQRARSIGLRFGVVADDRADHATVLNLAFWRPGDVAEVLADNVITADQLAHNMWHALAAEALGDDARSVRGLLLAEAIASAFDIYLVGRLLGHAPQSDFLATQVPAMADAASDAGCDEAQFEALLERATQAPEQSFELLRQLLFEVSVSLSAAADLDAAADVLQRAEGHVFAPLLHHYELSTWVLFARCFGQPGGEAAASLHTALCDAPDSIAWLQRAWLATP